MPNQTAVRMAEIVVSSDPGAFLVALGLGSCVGICLFDPVAGVAGLAHVVLPDSSMSSREEPPGKFADTVLEAMLEAMRQAGALRPRLRAAIAGGAHVFNFGTAGPGKLDIGARNAAAVLEELKSKRINLVAEDCGGESGRTVQLEVATGLVTVRTAGHPAQELANLSEGHHSPRLREAA